MTKGGYRNRYPPFSQPRWRYLELDRGLYHDADNPAFIIKQGFGISRVEGFEERWPLSSINCRKVVASDSGVRAMTILPGVASISGSTRIIMPCAMLTPTGAVMASPVTCNQNAAPLA